MCFFFICFGLGLCANFSGSLITSDESVVRSESLGSLVQVDSTRAAWSVATVPPLRPDPKRLKSTDLVGADVRSGHGWP